MNISLYLKTRLFGQPVGVDGYGNRYYQDRREGRPRHRQRWVIYHGDPEASKISPEWHGWLHYAHDKCPDISRQRFSWQKNHRRNLTGTERAYRPTGWGRSGMLVLSPTYQPWRPKNND